MFINSEPEQCPQAEIRENNEPKAQREKSVVQAKTRGNDEQEAQGKKGYDRIKREEIMSQEPILT